MHRILVTGGCGFIGRHVVEDLREQGYAVRVLDSLVEQVHGDGAIMPEGAELRRGDVRDPEAVAAALEDVDAVIHLAAEVGVGQSMYEIARYVGANDLGTAVLFQELIDGPVRRVVVASSMSIYGEGLYATRDGRRVEGARRRPGEGGWDPLDEQGRSLTPVPTDEAKRVDLASVYALSKYVQEQMTLLVAEAYRMEAVALRLFNVFGPGQALSNPYTGVLAIFTGRLLNGEPPLVFEDGRQRRDFVHVDDVADAFLLAMETPGISGEAFNIGSGRSYAIGDIARMAAAAMGRPDLEPVILEKTRAGDIRHCFADISKAQQYLGFAPRHTLEASLDELVAWVRRQRSEGHVRDAHGELAARGLVA